MESNFNLEATLDAMAILKRLRTEIASGPYAAWLFLDNAYWRLNTELDRYLRGKYLTVA